MQKENKKETIKTQETKTKTFTKEQLTEFKKQIETQKQKLIKIYEDMVEKINAFAPLIPLLDREIQNVTKEIEALEAKEQEKKA